jgi:hypothetical protein
VVRYTEFGSSDRLDKVRFVSGTSRYELDAGESCAQTITKKMSRRVWCQECVSVIRAEKVGDKSGARQRRQIKTSRRKGEVETCGCKE